MLSKKVLKDLLKATEWRLLWCNTFYSYWNVDEHINKLYEKKRPKCDPDLLSIYT